MRGEDRATEETGGGAAPDAGPGDQEQSGDQEQPGVVTMLAEERRQRRATPPPLPSRRSPPPVPPPVMQAPSDIGQSGGRHFSIPAAAPPIAGLPAEAPSVVERFHPAAQRRRWWWERWRETPCWLTSMVVHLAVMLVIGSIAVPPARVTGFNSWMLAFADEHDPQAEADLVIVQMDETQQDGGEEGEHQNPPPRVEEEEEVAFHAPAPVEPPEVESPATVIEEIPEDVEEHFPPAEAESPDAPEPPTPIRLASAAAPREAEPPAAPEMPAFGSGPPGMLEQNPVYDYVVDRFILYDIGQLRGAAGQQAKREFQALGPYAVPALVRGLNRSASIQASCPVVVIASKLEQSLSSAGDYQMIRYAVENIGRGVPTNAPHLARLQSLREALRRQHLDRPDLLRQELASQGVAASNEIVHAVTGYAQAPHEKLAAGVHSADPRERLAAVAATSRLTRAITDGQRSHLAAQLILRLGDEDSLIRRQADAGLAALLEVDPRRSAEWVRNADAGDPRWFWRDRLAEFDRAKRIEKNARALLMQGMTFERQRRRDAAQERYRRLLEEFPGADAAREAALRLAAGG
jgi:tetratricopeptide (TPR) repeat protein